MLLAITILESGELALYGDLVNEFVKDKLPTWELWVLLDKMRGIEEAELAVKELTGGVS